MEPTGRSVKLPEHIWRALDDMSKDGAQQADLLVRHAVEAFVALQGYELPAIPKTQPKTEHVERPPSAFAPVPAPAPAPAKAAPGPAPKAASPSPAAKPAPAPPPAAKPSPAPVAKPAPPAPTKASEAKTGALEPYGSVTEPVPKQKVLSAAAVNPAAATTPQTYDEEDDMGEGMTRVRMGPTPAPGQAMDGLTDPGLGEVPVVTDTRAAHEPSAPPVPDDSTVHGEAEGPAWIKRAALLDTDSDRTAARERMQAIDSDVGRLTIERPTTTALGEGAEADEEPEGDGDGEAPEADGDDAGDA